MNNNSRQILVVILIILTVGLIGVAVYLGITLQQSQAPTSSSAAACPAGHPIDGGIQTSSSILTTCPIGAQICFNATNAYVCIGGGSTTPPPPPAAQLCGSDGRSNCTLRDVGSCTNGQQRRTCYSNVDNTVGCYDQSISCGSSAPAPAPTPAPTPTPTPTPSSVPNCGNGLNCSNTTITGATQCINAAGDTVYCCPAGQQIINSICQLPVAATLPDTAIISEEADVALIGGLLVIGGLIALRFHVVDNTLAFANSSMKSTYNAYFSEEKAKRRKLDRLHRSRRGFEKEVEKKLNKKGNN